MSTPAVIAAVTVSSTLITTAGVLWVAINADRGAVLWVNYKSPQEARKLLNLVLPIALAVLALLVVWKS